MKPITSAHIILKDSRNRILLTRRRDVPIWVLPGGHCLNGEDPSRTAIRELLEETGYRAHSCRLVATYSTPSSRKMLCAGLLRDRPDNADPKEVSRLDWFDPHQLPKPITLLEKGKIHDYLNYNGRSIVRSLKLEPKAELKNLTKNPLIFLWLLFHFTRNRLEKKTFRLKLT